MNPDEARDAARAFERLGMTPEERERNELADALEDMAASLRRGEGVFLVWESVQDRMARTARWN